MKNLLFSITMIMTLLGVKCNKSHDNIYMSVSSDNIKEFIKIPNVGTANYYGAEKTIDNGYIYFVADIIIEKMDSQEIRFKLSNYKYSKSEISPSKKPDYYIPKDQLLDLLNLEAVYFGKIEKNKLVLNKQKIYYDSSTDRMIFILQ